MIFAQPQALASLISQHITSYSEGRTALIYHCLHSYYICPNLHNAQQCEPDVPSSIEQFLVTIVTVTILVSSYVHTGRA